MRYKLAVLLLLAGAVGLSSTSQGQDVAATSAATNLRTEIEAGTTLLVRYPWLPELADAQTPEVPESQRLLVRHGSTSLGSTLLTEDARAQAPGSNADIAGAQGSDDGDVPWWVAEGRACDGCPWRRPGHAFIQTTVVNVIYGVGNLIRGQVTARVTPKTWWDNMKHGWVWDLDDFTVNQFGHPYQGSNYFNTGRGNGLGFYESAGVTAFGSATWEYFGETNKASLNDFINTTLGGIALGEMFHRTAWLVRDTQQTGKPRVWREVGATVIDPLGGLNRWLSGDATRVTGKPPKLKPSSLAGEFSAGVLWQGEENRAVEEVGKPFAELNLLYGDITSGRSRLPYDAFFVRLRLGGGSAISAARIRGRLIGRPLGEGAFQLSLIQNYDFDNNPAYEFGAQAFEINLGYTFRPTERYGLYFVGGGGATALGAVDSRPLVEPPPPEHEPGEEPDQGVSEGPRTFDYGPGWNYAGRGVLTLDGFPLLTASAEGRHLFVVDGVRANHFLQRFGFDVRVPLPAAFDLGFSGEYFDRRTYYKDIDESFRRFTHPQLRVGLTWRLS